MAERNYHGVYPSPPVLLNDGVAAIGGIFERSTRL